MSHSQSSQQSCAPPSRPVKLAHVIVAIGALSLAILSAHYGGLLRLLPRRPSDDASAVTLSGREAVVPVNPTHEYTRMRNNGIHGLTVEPRESSISLHSKSVVLTVTNHGSKDVKITHVRPLCGCTVVANPEPDVVAPGGSSTISVLATPPGFGEKRTAVEVYHDGPAPTPLIAAFILKGRAPSVPEMVRQPLEVIARGRPRSETVARFELLTTEHSGTQPWIKAVLSDTEGVVVSRESIVEQRGPSAGTVRRNYLYRVALQLDRTGRSRAARLSLGTVPEPEGEQLPQIAVMTDCRPTVQAIPDTLFASLAASDLPFDMRVWFRATETTPVLTLSAEPAAADWVKVESTGAAPEGTPFAAQMNVRITALPKPSKIGEPTVLRVKTNIRDCAVVEIPLYVTVKRPK